jgi:hypothetical protein
MPGMDAHVNDTKDIAARLAAVDWSQVAGNIAELGYAGPMPLLSVDECAGLRALYDRDALFRSTIDMARYRFGEGQYRYFGYPLPPLIQALRPALYAHLAPLANAMMADMGRDIRYPAAHDDYLAECHAAGQLRPTPLILRYGPGGYNCLHQDLYGELRFPLQAVIQLSQPGDDFTGGEFLLVEQRPRAQSIGHAISPRQGEMIVFPVAERPVAGKRGFYRCVMRHGVSRLTAGKRYTLGIILHDAA